MQTNDIGTLQVRAAQALGRHADVLAAAARSRGGRARFALEKAEALVELMRHGEALRLATRALRRRPLDADVEARLRIVRGRSLWHFGGPARAIGELQRAEAIATAPLTRARALEERAHLEWREQRFEAGRAAADAALELYEQLGRPDGVVRALEAIAGILRDGGRFDPALRAHGRRIEAARATTRVDELARAYADRGDLLAFLGRWDAAAHDLDAAVQLFGSLGDERERTIARPRRAMIDLARGDFGAVERALALARECAFEAPRLRAEHHLLASDLRLASGDAAAAEASGREALQAFAVSRAREGTCRARIRIAHALVGQGRAAEARTAARDALRGAPAGRPDLRVLCLLALGRAELRIERLAARKVFEQALEQGETRSGLVSAARLGIALAARDQPAAERALEELERWDDRRLLAIGLADARELAMERPPSLTATEAPGTGVQGATVCAAALALTHAGAAVLRGGTWAERVAGAAEALRPVLAWQRAAWVGAGASEVDHAGGVRGLAVGDLARLLATRTEQPTAWDVAEGELSRHPTVVAHGIRRAVVAPVPSRAGEAWLYMDFREPLADPGRVVGLVAAAARLLGESATIEEPVCVEPEVVCADLLGGSEAMREVRATIGRVGPSGIAVHVFGETGTGKERVAHALHEASRRRGPLVAVNAAQLDDGLFEAALFGHAKGSFTGSVADRDGFVAAADGGTLFIDEVTELTARGQSKLLRFLESGEYVPVGETRPRRSDVRILSAANVPLRERVGEQRFRADLMYRLVDYTIALPPLRERGEDVLLLARHFLRDWARREGRSCPRLGAQAAKALRAHAWPGNVRELRKQMHRAVVLSRAGVVEPEHLQLEAEGGRSDGATLREARAAFERALLVRRLAEHGACRSRAAEALGITRQALALKIRQYGL